MNDLAGTRSECEISFEAKNASTITIRIGNAALLKNLLIGYRRAAPHAGMERLDKVNKATRGLSAICRVSARRARVLVQCGRGS